MNPWSWSWGKSEPVEIGGDGVYTVCGSRRRAHMGHGGTIFRHAKNISLKVDFVVEWGKEKKFGTYFVLFVYFLPQNKLFWFLEDGIFNIRN